MKISKLPLFLGILEMAFSSKVIEWQRDWGSGVWTREFAQVDDDTKAVLHFSTNDDASKSVPAVSLYDLAFRHNDFKKGIMAIRPLINEGQQLCFVTEPYLYWFKAKNIIYKRHHTVIPPVHPYDKFVLKTSFPSNLDPLSVKSLSDFCGVAHIFYMKPVDSVSGSKIKVHGLFRGYNIQIPEENKNVVFGNSV